MNDAEEPILKGGSSYLYTDKGVVRAYAAFKRLLAEGHRGLVITRSHPNRVQQLHGVDCPIMWIAKASKPTGGIISLEPTRLMKIHGTISDFIKTNAGAVVLLDGLEYLVTENGFGAVMKAIQLTNEEVAMSGSFLIVPIDPRTFETTQLGLLEREFSLPSENRRVPSQGGSG
ncbi:MAG: hypothetical protein A3K76_01580 [Euryarchaeota archaeon RBG_13_57_23]|nr:MAG: hypothetical protein A3K76_01580 [Euryarchaeota archaeon RBG_13_57_23]